MKQINYFITGSNGLLGQKIINQLIELKESFIASSKGDNRNSKLNYKLYHSIDLTNEKEINFIKKSFKPKYIINTAALTNVDLCEEEKKRCEKINVKAVEKLLTFAQSSNAKMIHISTDFIFDGKNGPYIESDLPNPINFYGKSKLNSEKILIHSDYENWAIVRTIIVYGTAENLSRNNIVLWAIDSLQQGKEIKIVNDQYRNYTFADDLARACILIAKKNKTGIFHISGEETLSIYDMVNKIAKQLNLDSSIIKPIGSKHLNQKAERPKKTGFNISKSKKILKFKPTEFEKTIDLIKKELNSTKN